MGIPRRLWSALASSAGLEEERTWAECSKKQMRRLAQQITACRLDVRGKGVFKDEFVTAGGADLRQLDPKTFECKKRPGLFLAGEVVDIDGITGGYNFMNAWATSWCAGTAIAEEAQQALLVAERDEGTEK